MLQWPNWRTSWVDSYLQWKGKHFCSNYRPRVPFKSCYAGKDCSFTTTVVYVSIFTLIKVLHVYLSTWCLLYVQPKKITCLICDLVKKEVNATSTLREIQSNIHRTLSSFKSWKYFILHFCETAYIDVFPKWQISFILYDWQAPYFSVESHPSSTKCSVKKMCIHNWKLNFYSMRLGNQHIFNYQNLIEHFQTFCQISSGQIVTCSVLLAMSEASIHIQNVCRVQSTEIWEWQVPIFHLINFKPCFCCCLFLMHNGK